MRNFRLGEWLPEAMTPLFTDWLLERLEHGYLQATRHHTGRMSRVPLNFGGGPDDHQAASTS
jgi:hypothetical protein